MDGSEEIAPFLRLASSSGDAENPAEQHVVKQAKHETSGPDRLNGIGAARLLASFHILLGHGAKMGGFLPSGGALYRFYSGGETWVTWFFMLSGYVLMHARLGSSYPSKVDNTLLFVKKRLASVYPIYAFCCLYRVLIKAYWEDGWLFRNQFNWWGQASFAFLVQAWHVDLYGEFKLLEFGAHFWFLSAMLLYWISFVQVYDFVRRLSFDQTLKIMALLVFVPFIVLYARGENDESYYANNWKLAFHRYHPLVYFHVFIFGMVLSRFRYHMIEKNQHDESSKSIISMVSKVPFYCGASIAYACLFLIEWNNLMDPMGKRIGCLMVFQGLLILGLSPLTTRGRCVDPIFFVYNKLPSWLGDVSYCMYSFQMIAFDMWPKAYWVSWQFVLFNACTACMLSFSVNPAKKWWLRAKGQEIFGVMVLTACFLAAIGYISSEK